MRTETRTTDAVGSFPASRHFVFWPLVVVGTAIDLYSKHRIFADVGYPPRPTEWVLNGWVRFRLTTSFNEGALWGLGQGFAWLFASLSVVAFTAVIYWLFFRGAAQSRWLTVALGLISAGTLGNLYDRLGLHGWQRPGADETLHAVRDFIHFQFGTFDWAVFNFADTFLVTGAIMLVIQSFQAEQGGAIHSVNSETTPVAQDAVESKRGVA